MCHKPHKFAAKKASLPDIMAVRWMVGEGGYACS